MTRMRWTRIIAGLVVAASAMGAFALNGCEEKVSNEYCLQFRHFSGTARDSTTQLPIDSVRLWLRDTTAGISSLTDSAGHYLTGSSGCDIQFFAQKNGYATKQKWLHGITGDVSDVDFELTHE